MLLIHSIFVFFFYSFLFFFTLRTVYVFWIRYKFDVISSNTHRSGVRITQVFDLDKCSISKTLLQVFKREMTLCNNSFLIHLYLLDFSGSKPSPFRFGFQHHHSVLAGENA